LASKVEKELACPEPNSLAAELSVLESWQGTSLKLLNLVISLRGYHFSYSQSKVKPSSK